MEKERKYLKPCPFCGRPANMIMSPMTKMVAFNCVCSSVIFYGAERDMEKAGRMWNMRARSEGEAPWDAEEDDGK